MRPQNLNLTCLIFAIPKPTLMKSIGLLFLFIPVYLSAQMVVTNQVDVPVFRENLSEIRNPWTGGLNAVQISMFDADGDGEEDDIFVFDKAGYRIMVFTGEMDGSERVFNFRPELASQFPPLKSWALLRDFNCDGKRDIFTYSPLGGSFAVYRNTSSGPYPSFTLETNAIMSEFTFSTIQDTTNIYVSSQDLPAIFDFDDDGDLDILTFGVSGSLVELHLNYSVEESGNCGLEIFRLKNRCYGRFMEGGESNTIITDPELVSANCTFNVVNPKSADPGHRGDNRHIGSTILAFDATQDGLVDLVLGDVTYTNLTYLENSDRGPVLVDSVVSVVTDFPANFGGTAADLDNFPSAFYEDIDGDGIRDLLLSVNNPNVAINQESLWYYRNNGQDDLPVFELLQTDFLQDETIDYGEGSAPALFDYNGDGLNDLVIGTRGRYLGDAVFKPSLALFLNTGTATDPEFTLADPDWLNVSQVGLGQYVYPTFGDFDGDGDFDLLLGDASGKVFLFKNTAGVGNIPSYAPPVALMADGETIDVGQTSTPQLFDLNQDGLPDLIVGERNGNLNYFENSGTSQSPQFTFITDTLGGVSSIAPFYFTGSSSPMFFRYNDTTYLAVGSEAGTIFHYTGIDGNLGGAFELISMQGFGINAGAQSKPYIADINADGLPDIFMGSVGGGVQLFLGDGVAKAGHSAFAKTAINLYPNPATNQVTFELPQRVRFPVEYEIYSFDGKRIRKGLTQDGVLYTGNLSKGLYILKIQSGADTFTSRFSRM